jgi:predicted secreted hydrolase
VRTVGARPGFRISDLARRSAWVAAIWLAAPPTAPLQFPRDHGAHPEAAVEWWYYTGHLEAPGGREYGFQLTFFRVRDLHLAHFAWTDVGRATFVYEEKTHLGLPGIAGAATGGLDVSNEDWSVREDRGVVRLSAGRRDLGELALTLTPSKPPVLHGGDGLSKKGPGENESSRYVSITRLAAAGMLTHAGVVMRVSGTAWFDHEWGPGALPAGAAGWDWFALQLDDGSDLMLYRMRLAGGAASPYSAGTFVPAGGPPRAIAWDDITLAPRSTWTSARSRAVYPAAWSLAVRSLGLETTITPLVADQELATEKSTGVTYWEGACRVAGYRGGRPIGGRAYVEMTGYAGRDVPGLVAP